MAPERLILRILLLNTVDAFITLFAGVPFSQGLADGPATLSLKVLSLEDS